MLLFKTKVNGRKGAGVGIELNLKIWKIFNLLSQIFWTTG
jgi:hypothetical protein